VSLFVLKAGGPTLPKQLSRRILITDLSGLDSCSPDEPRPAKVQSEVAGSGTAAYKYHMGNN